MKGVYAFLTIIIFWSCTDKVTYEKPEDLIGKEEMIDLLYDMHVVIGTSNIKNVHLEKNRNYMSLTYKKYDIDSTEFSINNLYYTSSIDEYEEIFEAVQRRLKKLQDSIYDATDSLIRENKTPDYYKRMQEEIEN